MDIERRLEVFYPALYNKEESRVYAVLDGASIPNLQQLFVEHNVNHICLYRGELEPDLAESAPYLVELPPESTFLRLFLQEGWGRHWGILAVSSGDLLALRMHFRKFLMVWDANGKMLYFRYYDPRVLRIYLPTCNKEELQTVFGPVETYLMEGETPNICLGFTFAATGLAKHEIVLPELNVI